MRLPDQLRPRETQFEQELFRIIERYDAQAFALGIQITLEHDFDAFKKVSNQLDKLPLTPNFDPEKIDVGPANAFWMRGVDTANEIVFVQAARLYDCRHTTLALLHESLHAFYADPTEHAEVGETCRCDAPATHFLTDDVCYHGELWLTPSYRGRNVPRILSRLLMALVLLRWRPTALFGMAQPGICTRGVAAKYGYRNMQPHGMIWHIPSNGTLDEWIIWNDADDLRDVIRER